MSDIFNLFNLQDSVNFHKFFMPGIYIIFNTMNGKCYIGETENVADRLSDHYKVLTTQKKHGCAELQADWNLQNRKNFSFDILYCGPEWDDKVLRLQKERELFGVYWKRKSLQFCTVY